MVKRYDRNYPLDIWFNGNTHQICVDKFDTRPQAMKNMLRERARESGFYLEAAVRNKRWLVIRAFRLHRGE